MINSELDALAAFAKGISSNETSFYGFSIPNDDAALAQSGSGYFDMQTADPLAAGSYVELGCGGLVRRKSGLLTFELPSYFRAAFIVAVLNHEAGGLATKYGQIRLEYGANNDRKQIAFISKTGADYRGQLVMMGSYAGLTSPERPKFVIQTYGSQAYYGVSVLIGVTV